MCVLDSLLLFLSWQYFFGLFVHLFFSVLLDLVYLLCFVAGFGFLLGRPVTLSFTAAVGLV